MNAFFSQLTDAELLARLIYGEARGEPYEGQKAVAFVAINRTLHPGWWGNTLREVILRPYQFSCFLPEYNEAIITPTESVWLICVKLSLAVLTNVVVDPTDGATSYHAISITPDWAASMTKTVQIAQHVFYK